MASGKYHTPKSINKFRYSLPRTGDRYGKLIVIGFSHYEHRIPIMTCRCDCGVEKAISSRNLRVGSTRSCGCLRKAKTSQLNRTHGEGKTALYQRWCNMKARCQNPNNANYRNYGGRGITVCSEWEKSFESFRDWAYSTGYKEDLEIDRINNDGHYEPENCRWATIKENLRNKRVNHMVTAFGETKCIAEWYEDSRCNAPSKDTLYQRINHTTMSSEQAITTPKGVRVRSDGAQYSIRLDVICGVFP